MYVDNSNLNAPKWFLLGIASNGPLSCRDLNEEIYYGGVWSHSEWIAKHLT